MRLTMLMHTFWPKTHAFVTLAHALAGPCKHGLTSMYHQAMPAYGQLSALFFVSSNRGSCCITCRRPKGQSFMLDVIIRGLFISAVKPVGDSAFIFEVLIMIL